MPNADTKIDRRNTNQTPTPRKTLSGSRVATALREIPDWSIGATALRATYSADVGQDGIWGALADLAGLTSDDLTLEWEG